MMYGMKASHLLVGNWKLNPVSGKQSTALLNNIITESKSIRGIDLVVCPPHLYLAQLRKNYSGKKITFGAQDISLQLSGAHTGQISAAQIADIGARYTILGHSERRTPMSSGGMAETDELINQKIKIALKYNLIPIVCIGESKRSETGQHLSFIKDQIKATFMGLSGKQMAELVIAYEPIWAIGGRAGTAISGHDLHQMVLYIRKIANEIWGTSVANKLTILYGGSVKPENAYELTANGNMNGFLVGGASLAAESFLGIAKQMIQVDKDKIKNSKNKTK